MAAQSGRIVVGKSLDPLEAESVREKLAGAVAARAGCRDPVLLDIEPGRASALSLQLLAACLRSLQQAGCPVDLGPSAAACLGKVGLKKEKHR